jgi:hypothetical protein
MRFGAGTEEVTVELYQELAREQASKKFGQRGTQQDGRRGKSVTAIRHLMFIETNL